MKVTPFSLSLLSAYRAAQQHYFQSMIKDMTQGVDDVFFHSVGGTFEAGFELQPIEEIPALPLPWPVHFTAFAVASSDEEDVILVNQKISELREIFAKKGLDMRFHVIKVP